MPIRRFFGRIRYMNCEFCNFKGLTIKEYKNWVVHLDDDQRYLGRCIIRLRRHADDFFNINGEELKEFFEITKKLRNVVKEIFGADMFNYAILGNVVRHVHLHFIPRYSKEVNFLGIDFKDEKWGQHYAPYNKFKISEEVESEIIDKIRKKL